MEYGPFNDPVIQSYTRHIARDVKGVNILVDPNGEIELVDFGMAKHGYCYWLRSKHHEWFWLSLMLPAIDQSLMREAEVHTLTFILDLRSQTFLLIA
ncbi:hypothetical protein RIF29_38963 [Crotalaria pallida]|uniref:Protein kinase domain-containing protein n=1 Tax=Crotalaria pallida TaxID=3830 RepID=A0AAN9E0Z1_CROPI